MISFVTWFQTISGNLFFSIFLVFAFSTLAICSYPFYWTYKTAVDLRKHLDQPTERVYISLDGVKVEGWPEGWTADVKASEVTIKKEGVEP